MDFHHEEEHQSFLTYFWQKKRCYVYLGALLFILGLPIFKAGVSYSYQVKEPICGCEMDKEYCCPEQFNHPPSLGNCHNDHQCYCYRHTPHSDMRLGEYFCMPLEESQSFETKNVEEPSPLLLGVGFCCLLLGVSTLTAVFWGLPSAQQDYEALEVKKEMSFLEFRRSVAQAAVYKDEPDVEEEDWPLV